MTPDKDVPDERGVVLKAYWVEWELGDVEGAAMKLLGGMIAVGKGVACWHLHYCCCGDEP